MHDSNITTTSANKEMAELRVICDRELAELSQNYPEISLAVVASADARLISFKSAITRDGNRLAAMTGALLGLCESMARELSAGACRSTIVSMDDYTCIIVHIEGPQYPLVLAIGVDHSIMLALSRRVALDLATRISSRMYGSS
ncbi:roadblock/LC7 domain-containing protein [Rhodanobacter sp. A1T4]|jgi:predicted regulator of Ras-like GTPase activity (Roadblock/LC7/MglB family)|uniref:roadblock/LC7 domain-containing protein n=1 Tax=Rhodanobacter sp. A1T4 TaxID=2723087 RepID=UPI0016139A38|nr:roadblock/LC7 domain-containing protein [Rhodanobacter sp. A1T4]MBB6248381.1 putative regulator of Ras-like GTPase activity (Roadblock/LC7/MglB family) [Rhodanobacter sp. A1T4]